jgi:hypothetical protein
MKAASLILAAGTLLLGSLPGRGEPLPYVVTNENRIPAGRLHGDTLEISLEVRMATWRPEADSGPVLEVAAFAEEARLPRSPARSFESPPAPPSSPR